MFARRMQRLSSSLIREILALTQAPDMISFAGGLPAAEVMPDWIDSTPPADWRQYARSEGEQALREWVADQMCAVGRRCGPEQVLITSGSQQGIDLVSRLMVEEGSQVLLESPTYLAALQNFNLLGASYLGYAVGADGIDRDGFVDALAQNPCMAYLNPTFQNPTGYCYSEEERQFVARQLDDAGVLLFEDDPYRALNLDGVHTQPLVSHIEKAPWIYAGSFSKMLMPGLRLGYLVVREDLMAPLLRLKQTTDLHTCRVSQWQLLGLLQHPEFESRLAHANDFYRHKRALMANALEAHFSDIAQWQTPEGGLFFWLTLKQDFAGREMVDRALSEGVGFMPGFAFYPEGQVRHNTLRLNFSHASDADIGIGIQRLAALFMADQG